MTATQTVLRNPAEAQTRHVLGMQHRNLLLPQEGGFLLIDATIPAGCGSPLHLHERDAECFHILDGELVITDGQGEHTARPGDTCLLPAGSAHGFTNRGSRPVRALVVVTPGEDARQFFDELDVMSLAGTLDVPAVCAAGLRHALQVCAA